MKKLLFLLLALPLTALASGGGFKLDRAPVNINNHESLQRGARVFVNYCLNCHSANYMRYNRMADIGLSEKQIKENLMFAADKPGETMYVAMRPAEAKSWFGVTPPDLTVITRSRGNDWVYTYLRNFYRDPTRPSGWNNLLFDKVAMPHVLHDLQGHMMPVKKEVTGHDGKPHEVIEGLELTRPGKLTPAEYDALLADLVNYMTWMGEPAKAQRMTTGVLVMIFFSLFLIVSYYMKKEFWKDVH